MINTERRSETDPKNKPIEYFVLPKSLVTLIPNPPLPCGRCQSPTKISSVPWQCWGITKNISYLEVPCSQCTGEECGAALLEPVIALELVIKALKLLTDPQDQPIKGILISEADGLCKELGKSD